ncbi:MAG: hypothetical protein KKG60_00285 [Nanoarchaeota archaeon]|nr:hypothetical protein [Nanoarchaeota archaeon]
MMLRICENITDVIEREKAFILKREIPKGGKPEYLFCDECGLGWMLRIKGKFVNEVHKVIKEGESLLLQKLDYGEVEGYKKKYHL